MIKFIRRRRFDEDTSIFHPENYAVFYTENNDYSDINIDLYMSIYDTIYELNVYTVKTIPHTIKTCEFFRYNQYI